MKYFFLFLIIFSLFFENVFSVARAADSCSGLSGSDCSSNNHPTCCWDGSVCQTGPRTTDPAPAGTCASSGDTLTGDLTNPLSGSTDVVKTTELVSRIIKWIFAIVGALALLMFIIGGTYWLVSFGNETRITKGRQILIWASVGLLLIFSSYAIINYVLGSLVR